MVVSLSFRKSLAKVKNPYGDGGASKKMLELLKKMNFGKALKKKFYDIKFKV